MSSHPTGRPIAAFDFDGTLSIRDSFVAFLKDHVGLGSFLGKGLKLIPSLVKYLSDRDRGRVKSDMLALYLPHMTAEQFDVASNRFADRVFARFIRPDALARLKWHLAQGHEVVIVTASPRLLVAPFARRLGATHIIGSELQYDPIRNALQITGANCRAQEKVERLKAHYGEDLNLIAAYGDTSGDAEMIALAKTQGMKLFTKRP